MKEKYKVTNYPSKNMQTETYKVGEVFITKHYYDAKDAYIRELIHIENGIKEIKHFSVKGVLAKVEYFVDDKRHGIETKYSLVKADKSIKSTKTYENGKLHGKCITYNENGKIIKEEVYADGKRTLKYERDALDKITNIQIVDKDNLDNLPKAEYEKLQDNMQKNPEWFK
jgi:antitoxin component YwqK of YwqJK toxin-antitoxin module